MRLATVALVLMAALPARAEGPFAHVSFDDAAARARAEGKLLIVDFMSTWCPPCQQMEKVTWPDAKLGEWLAAHAIAIQVDIDQQPGLAKRFDVDSVPTVIGFRDGQELDRHTDFWSATDIVRWGMELLSSPQQPEQRLAEILEALAVGPMPAEVFRLGQKLARLGQFDEATQALLRAFEEGQRNEQTWRREYEQGKRTVLYTSGWRLRELVPEMAKLAAKHPPACEAFGKLVAAAEARVYASDPPGRDDWNEWTTLCDAFDRDHDVLRWYEAKRDAQGRLFGGGDLRDKRDDFRGLRLGPEKFLPPRGLDGMRDKVVTLLGEAGRFADALALLEDPPARAREAIEERSFWNPGFYAAAQIWCLAMRADRQDVADAVAKEILDRDKTGEGRTQLLTAAWCYDLVARAPCPRWRDEAIKLGRAGEGVLRLDPSEFEPPLDKAPENDLDKPPSGG